MKEPLRPIDVGSGLAKLGVGVGLGSLVEYYDFFIAIFGATIVWPSVFFSWANASVAYGLSLASFGVLYFTRPIGAYIFGQLGDRRGRKSMVLLTLSIMGVGTLGVGLDPSYGTIGITSVVLLFFFRALFGLGLGGEFGGAASWLVEAAQHSRWRAFWALWAAPSQIGYALASFSFTLVAATFGKQFLTVGWRIPFVLGAVLIIIGIVIRYSLEESPLFRSLKEARMIEESPASRAMKEHWREILLLSGIMLYVLLPAGAVQASYGIPYLITKGISSAFVTYSIGISAAVGSLFLIFGALSGDILSRRLTLIASAMVALLAVLLYIPLLDTHNPTYIVLAQILIQAPTAVGLAISSATFAEYFPTRLRYSASGLSFQLGGLYYGVIVTFVEPALFAAFGIFSSAPYVVAMMVVTTIVSLTCIFALRETGGPGMALQ